MKLHLLALLFLASCAGVKARDVAGMNTARLLYPDISDHITRGVAGGEADNDLTPEDAQLILNRAVRLGEILQGDDRSQLFEANWPLLKTWADRGVTELVEQNQLPPAGAKILEDHVNNFDRLMRKLMIRITHNSNHDYLPRGYLV